MALGAIWHGGEGKKKGDDITTWSVQVLFRMHTLRVLVNHIDGEIVVLMQC